MAILTLTVAANDDDWYTSEVANESATAGGNLRVGGVGTSPPAGHGAIWRFTGASALKGATINSVKLSLMKSATTQFSQQADRWTFEDSDSPAAASASSPNRPGDRPITTVVAETHDVNHVASTRYEFPTTGALRTDLAASLQTVVNRAGFVDTLALINNSDQDAGASLTTLNKTWCAFESTTADSEPQLIVDYTPGSISGVLTKTLGALTTVAAGALDIQAALSKTLAVLTLMAAGGESVAAPGPYLAQITDETRFAAQLADELRYSAALADRVGYIAEITESVE